jgi:hypothetical protein
MNLYSVVQASYGGRLKRAGLVRRRRSLKETRDLRYFFLAYADETTKATYVAPGDIGAQNEEEYLRAVLARVAPLRPEIDYVPFRSRVVAFGRAAHPKIYGTHELENMPDAERMDRLRKWWLQDTAAEPTKAHHVVFSLDPRLVAAMTEAGASADSFLLKAVGDAFTEFQSRFYPGDVLGYLVALHHDRAHVHAHVLVNPLTQNGSRVNLSILRRFRLGDRVVDVPCQQVLKDAFERETEAACERYIPRPPEGQEPASQRQAEAAEQIMLLARVQRQPGVKGEKGIDLGALLRIREEFLGRADYCELVRQGRDAVSHLFAEDVATGQRYVVRHNFAAIADKGAKARFQTVAQARSALGMFSARSDESSTIYVKGIEPPRLRSAHVPRANPTLAPLSFFAEVRGRKKYFELRADSNERLRQEVAELRATILREDKTETECIITSANTLLHMMGAIAPSLGYCPKFLTLWTPAPDGRPRLAPPTVEGLKFDQSLTEAAAALASHHQPVNPSKAGSAELAAQGEPSSGDIHTHRIVGARPGFLANRHEVKWDNLLPISPPPPPPPPSRRPKGPEPTPG